MSTGSPCGADEAEAIDAVVTWVDGNDPAHAAKRLAWTGGGDRKGYARRGASAHRFVQHGEILTCLRSIRTHAPWIRTVWLVTDDQVPAGIDAGAAARHGIRLVSHQHLFRGLEALLPTFCSYSIETLLWRIEGLARRFLYFNDDMFLAAPVTPADFFDGDRVRLRMTPFDWSTRAPRGDHGAAQMRAAAMAGFPLASGFIEAHVAYPLLRDTMADVHARHLPAAVANAAYRIRARAQYFPIALHNFTLAGEGRAILADARDTLYLTQRQCRDEPPAFMEERLARLEGGRIKLACINAQDLLTATLPGAAARIAGVAGEPAPWEREAGAQPIR